MPLTVQLDLFDSKVHGVLSYGRWLACTVDNAESMMNDRFDCWARALLGAPMWKHAAPLHCELGWQLSGYDHCVLAAALRDAKLRELADGDLCGDVYKMGLLLNVPSTWSRRASLCLRDRGVPAWLLDTTCTRTLDSYKTEIKKLLASTTLAARRSDLVRHGGSVPYGVFATDALSSVRLSGKLTLSWRQRLQMRNWSRFRTGVVVLAAKNGVRSTAKFQNCVFCNALVRNPMVMFCRSVSFGTCAGRHVWPELLLTTRLTQPFLWEF